MNKSVVAFFFALFAGYCLATSLPSQGVGSTASSSRATVTRLLRDPVWPITIDGTATPVDWVPATNPRFAVFDPSTPADETDDLVLDRETGLIWQRSPTGGSFTWWEARDEGFNHDTPYLKRKGWRLPAVEELTTLAHSYVNPSLPAGHPFVNVESNSYWTSTSHYLYYPVTVNLSRTNYAHVVHFNNGAAGWEEKMETNPVWLVRGGRGHDGM